MKNLKDKVIVIAGASGGIGSALYTSLLKYNSNVIGISRTVSIHLKNFAEQNNLKFNWITSDLTSGASWEDALHIIKERFGKIDVLINCVGILIPGKIENLTIEQIEKIISTNFTSFVLGTKLIISIMKRQGYGHVINLGSLGGIVPMPYESIYSATKFALRGFTLSLKNELSGSGIKISLISPGPVLTKMLAEESFDDNSTIAFVNRPLSAGLIAKKIINTIYRPKTEVMLPAFTKPASILIGIFPGLFERTIPVLNFIGKRNRNKISAQLDKLYKESLYENGSY